MKIEKFKISVMYHLSCQHETSKLINAKGCTTTCPFDGERVFILDTIFYGV